MAEESKNYKVMLRVKRYFSKEAFESMLDDALKAGKIKQYEYDRLKD